MANRRATIDKDHLYCPNCKIDYSNTNVIERFEKTGNNTHLIFPCDCKQKLALRLMVNGWFKIYDVTEIYERKNLYDKQQRKLRNHGTI